MSLPPTKRQRFNPSSSSEEPSSHIFAPSSSNPTPSSNSVLRPCSFEVTLNHDADLKRSLHTTPSLSHNIDEVSGWGTRLTTWTNSSGNHRIITDRYDAIHLLPELPAKIPCPASAQDLKEEENDVGWSDLDSDTEDLFYMTDTEAANFTRTKAKARLEAHHSTRLAHLRSPTPPSAPTTPFVGAINEGNCNQCTEAEAQLSKSQFDLMAKTARVLASSTNPSMLELKILANHGGDERFSFLRNATQDGKNDDVGSVWKELKRTKGEMSYNDAVELLQPTKNDRTIPGIGLVAYDDTESESRTSTPPAEAADKATAEPQAPTEKILDQVEAEKKRKQAERLARAKEWLKTRPKPTSSSTIT